MEGIMKQAVRFKAAALSAPSPRHLCLPPAVLAALLILFMGGVAQAQAPDTTTRKLRPAQSPESPQWPLLFSLEPKGQIDGPGHATLNLTITPSRLNTDKRDVKIIVTVIGKLGYPGALEWRATFPDSTPLHREIEVTIPPHDTSGVELSFQSASMPAPLMAGAAFFVAEGDSVKFFRGDPRGFDFPRTQVPIGELPPQGRRIKGEFPHWDSLYPIPDDTAELPTITYYRVDRSASERATRDSLEQFPLTDRSIQYVTVDGQTLERRKGEIKFHPIEAKTFAEWNVIFQKRHDSAMEANKNVRSDTWIDLHNPTDLAFAKGLIDSLMPTDTAGIYRAAINRSTLIRLSDKGIRTRKWGTIPGQRKPIPMHREKDKLNLAPKRDPTVYGAASPQSQLFSEGFEGTFPGNRWSIGDSNSWNGYDYWGDVYQCGQSSGSWSCWCSKNGDMPACGDNYDNYMNAYLKSAQPIDVTNKTNISLNYSIVYDVEATYDFVNVYYSWDSTTWIYLTCYDGYYGNWLDESQSIPTAGNSLYIAFQFLSDGTNVGSYFGAYLDDIAITADPIPQPNLVPYWPSGWSSEIVASAVPGTNTNATLYAGEPAYIDVAVKNLGSGTSGSFYTGVYADGILIGSKSSSGLWSNEYCTTTDVLATMTSGTHTMRVKADIYNTVTNETSETDNEYATTFTWQAPYLTFTGYLSYWDMNPPPHTVPLKNVTIEMRDWDAAGTQLLATATTQSDGRFAFNSVYNLESDGDGHQQDILFRVYADNTAAYLTGSSGGAAYTYDFSVAQNHRSGSFDTSLTIPQAQSSYFYPISVVRDAYDKWCTVGSPPGKAHLVLAGMGTYTDPNSMTTYIDSTSNVSLFFPDTYDRDVIDHEYGHWLADHFQFLDYGGAPQHTWYDTVSLETAAGEAFAHLFSSWASGDPTNVNRYSNFAHRYARNLENGEYGTDGGVTGSVNNWGRKVEGAVAGMLWDIYDSVDDDYSTFNQPCRACPDGIRDSLTDNMADIVSVLTTRTVNGHHPRTIKEFWDAWYQSTTPGHVRAVCDIYYEHGDKVSCCIGTTGNVNMTGIVDSADLAALVSYLVNGGFKPPCFAAANVNAVGAIDSADLSALTSYLTGGGYILPACQSN
jgi:hypothetical protein